MPDKFKILISTDEVQKRIEELAESICKDCGKLAIVAVLNGARIFAEKLADELKKKGVEFETFFIQLASYGKGKESSGNIKLMREIEGDIKGKDVLIVEDIVDTGLTADYLVRHLLENGAKSVKVCALANKPSRRQVPVEIHYTGFEVPDKFIVGFGMDFQEKYRELPYIAVLE